MLKHIIREMKTSIVFLIPAVLLFWPFFRHGHMPVWSTDNFYGSYPCLVFAAKTFPQEIIWWNPFSLTGMDFTSSVANFIFNPIFMLLYILPYKYFWVAMTLLQFSTLWAIGRLGYAVVKHIVREHSWALMGGLILQLCNFTQFDFGTFPNAVQNMLFLALCLAIIGLRGNNYIRSFILFVVLLSLMALTGHPVYFANLAFFLPVFFLITRQGNYFDKDRKLKPFILFFSGSVCAALLTAFRWLPFVLSLSDSNRSISSLSKYFSASSNLEFIPRFFVPEIWGWAIGASYQMNGMANQHGQFYYFGTIAAFLLVLSFFIPRHTVSLSWKVLGVFYIVGFLRIGPFAQIEQLGFFYPLIHGSWQRPAAVVFAVLACLSGKWLTEQATLLNKPEIADPLSNQNYLNKPLANFRKVILAICIISSLIAVSVFFQWYTTWPRSGWVYYILKASFLAPAGLFLLRYLFSPDSSGRKFWTKAAIFIFIAELITVFVYSVTVGMHKGSDEYRLLLHQKLLCVILAISLVVGLWIWHRRYKMLSIIYVVIFAFAYVVYMQLFYSNYHNEGHWLYQWPLKLKYTYWLALQGLAYFMAVSLCFLLIIKKVMTKRLPPKGLAILLVAITLVEMTVVFWEFSFYVCKPFVTMQQNQLYAPAKELEKIDISNYRVNYSYRAMAHTTFSPAERLLTNIDMSLLTPAFGGLHAQTDMRTQKYFTALDPSTYCMYGIISNSFNQRLLDLTGVKYDFVGKEMQVRPGALSRFTMFYDYEVIDDENKLLQRLKEGTFNPQMTILLNRSPSVEVDNNAGSSAKSISLKYSKENNTHMTLRTSSDRDAIILFNDTYHPNWQALIDGKPVEILSANYRMMAVAIPAGNHTIEFIYNTKDFIRFYSYTFLAGFLLFIITSIACFKGSNNKEYSSD